MVGGTRDLRMEMNSALGVVVAGVVLEGAMTSVFVWGGMRGRVSLCVCMG